MPDLVSSPAPAYRGFAGGDAIMPGSPRESGRPLTPRELEVAALVAEGLTNAEIAQRLALTRGTVGNHIGHILRALGLRNRAQVAAWAVQQGLYPRPR
jgi:DNA-binding NarL/FixJ family response regulator